MVRLGGSWHIELGHSGTDSRPVTPVPASHAARSVVYVALAVVSVVTGTLTVAWMSGRPVASSLLVHGGVLLLLLGVGRYAPRIRGEQTRALLTAVVALGTMFFLYGSLGEVAFSAIPWDGDLWVRAWDRAVFLGVEPVARVGDWVALHAWVTEPLAIFYAAFIPYVYLSLFLGLIGRQERVRSVLVLAFVLLYAMSFMGYLFVPARGPVVSMTDVLTVPLDGGFIHALVIRSVDAVGGPHGAFPSLHVGASSLLMLVDSRHGDMLRGLIYVPLVLLICLATVVLRYHYVVDIFAGALFAFIALRLAETWVSRLQGPVKEVSA